MGSTLWALTFLPAVLATSSSQYRKLTVSRDVSRSGYSKQPLSFENQWLNGQGGYFVDIGVGTPSQPFKVLLDTGSSNLFVPSASAAACRNYTCPAGIFNSRASSSFSQASGAPHFKIGYVDGSEVEGMYATDVVTLGDASLSNFTFALADVIQVSPGVTNGAQYGIMGVSFDKQETDACLDVECSESYMIPTVVDALYSSGYAGSRSYSLYLDDAVEQKGSLIFGGIDTAKFSGDLVTLATLKHQGPDGDPFNGEYVEQGLYLTSGAALINGTTTQLVDSGFSNPVILDSGAGSLSIPETMFNALANVFPEGLLLDSPYGLVTFCDQSTYEFALSLGFTGADGKSATVDVPFRELLVPIYDTSEANGGYNSTTFETSDGRTLCKINLSKGSDGALLLAGDPLLRSAYVFYNLDEATISIAQPSFYTEQENIVAVGSGPTPDLKGTGADSIEGSDVTVPAPATGTAGYAVPSTTSSPDKNSANVFKLPLVCSYVFVAMWTVIFGFL